jgi:hypothetical protein
MLKSWFMAAFLAAVPVQVDQSGIIAGAVIPPPEQRISEPLQVILLSSRYTNIWNSDVQKRLDAYWEIYKTALKSRKDFFSQVSRQAQWEATTYVLMRMRGDSSHNVSDYLQETSADGKFEFKNVPFGEYKVLAVGKLGEQEVMWQEFVDVRSQIPQFLELNKRLP